MKSHRSGPELLVYVNFFCIPTTWKLTFEKYIGKKPPPQKLISSNKENYRVSNPYLSIIFCSKLFCSKLFPIKTPSSKFKPSLAPTLLSNGPYDDADPQPCPVCRSNPVLASQHLNALFMDDHEAISGLGLIGVQTDLEFNMLLMLNEHERHELIRASSLSPVKKVSVKNKLKTLQVCYFAKCVWVETWLCLQPVVHVKPDISVCR